MRNIELPFVMDEDSERGRAKTYTHKWECFRKLRMYEKIGTLDEIRRWKDVYEWVTHMEQVQCGQHEIEL